MFTFLLPPPPQSSTVERAWTPLDLDPQPFIWLDANDSSTITTTTIPASGYDDLRLVEWRSKVGSITFTPYVARTLHDSYIYLDQDAVDIDEGTFITTSTGNKAVNGNRSYSSGSITGLPTIGLRATFPPRTVKEQTVIAYLQSSSTASTTGYIYNESSSSTTPVFYTGNYVPLAVTQNKIVGKNADFVSATSTTTVTGNLPVDSLKYQLVCTIHDPPETATPYIKTYLNGVGSDYIASHALNTTYSCAQIRQPIGATNADYATLTTFGQYSCGLTFLLVIDKALSTEDRQRLEGYLAHEGSFTDKLQSDHPYRNSPPMITVVM